jgi:hypothetical protein
MYSPFGRRRRSGRRRRRKKIYIITVLGIINIIILPV